MDAERRRHAVEMARSLEKRGLADAAIQAFQRAGEIDEAVRVLVSLQRFGEAGRMLLQSIGVDFPQEVRSLDAGAKRQALKAAVCFAKAGDSKTSVDLFVALDEHARAIDLLKRIGDTAGAARLLALQQRRGPTAPQPRQTPGVPGGVAPTPRTPRETTTLTAAQKLEAAGQQREAMEAYVVLKRFGDAGRVALALGMQSLAGEFFGKAGMAYEAAVCYAQGGETGVALEHFVRVPRDDRRYRPACVRVIALARELQLLDFQVEHFLAKFVASGPQSDLEMDAFYVLADLYRKHDFPDNARESLGKILARDAGYRDAAARLAALDEEARGSVAAYQKIMKEEMAFRLDTLPSPPRAAPGTPREAPPSAPPRAGTVNLRGVAPPAIQHPPQVTGETPATAAHGRGLEPGVMVGGRYKLDRHLGKGGMAVVFKAMDLELGEAIAMKFITTGIDDERMLARFKQEVALARQLSHPNIVRVHDLGMYEDLRYITMELLEGRDLRKAMERPMAFPQAIDYLVQACAGLGYAHGRGIVHRDIKPENMFVTTENVLKLMDFGIAKRQATRGLTVAGFIVGTPEYMSPEQINDFSAVGFAADIYALGVVAYQMFTGSVPFTHEEMMPLLMMHLTQPPQPPTARNPDVPPDLERVILRMLEKDPAARFGACSEVAERLERLRERV